MGHVSAAGVSRRGFSVAMCAGTAISVLPKVGHGQAGAKYLVGTLLKDSMQGRPVLTCSEVDKKIAYLEAEARRAAADPAKVGGEMLAQFKKQQKALSEAVVQLDKTNTTATIEQHIGRAGLALGIALSVGLLYVPAKVALGVGAAVEILKAPTKLVIQAYYLPDQNKPDMLVAYAEDRLAFLSKEIAGALGKRTLQGLLAAGGYYLTAVEWARESNSVDKARIALAFATSELKAVNTGLTELGDDPKKWAALYQAAAESGAKGLNEYRKATANSNCLLVSPPRRTLS